MCRRDCHIISGNAQEVSNVACVCRINETGWTWVQFQTTPPISTFSVAVVVLDLDSTSAITNGG
jgi:aminopeptidase N